MTHTLRSPKVIVFSYPRRGLTGDFATFRLGPATARDYEVGDKVNLVASGTFKLLKHATVTGVYVGGLRDVASKYGALAHNWKDHPEAERPDLLLASIRKRYKHYGPERTADDSVCSVICLREEP